MPLREEVKEVEGVLCSNGELLWFSDKCRI